MKRLLDLFRRKPAPEPVRIEGEGVRAVQYVADPNEVFASREVAAKTLQDLIQQHLKATGIEGTVEVRPRDIGIKPPADPKSDGWTWEAWARESKAMGFPGWSPCRFAHRIALPDQPDMARFVFGITRGPFGIWKKDFDVCGQDDDGDWAQERTTLSCLTHLPTGMGMGLFKSTDYAALAADTALRANQQAFNEVEYTAGPGTPWDALMKRTGEAWYSLGIIPASNAHAHDDLTKTGPYPILGLAENLNFGRPEKLS